MRGFGAEEGTSSGLGGRTGPTSWWTVTRRAGVGVAWEALTVRCGGREALAVFSFVDEAELFLRLEGLGPDGWVVRETSCGELASVLCGLCADAAGVALDPPPGGVADEALLRLLVVGREEFLERLLPGGGGARNAMIRAVGSRRRGPRPGPPRTTR